MKETALTLLAIIVGVCALPFILLLASAVISFGVGLIVALLTLITYVVVGLFPVIVIAVPVFVLMWFIFKIKD